MLKAEAKLTDEQRAVVHHDGANARVLAVAGSGKTLTMIVRCLELVQERKVAPRRLQVLMFNRDARLDFAGRLRALAQGWQPDSTTVQTHHAFAYRLLREHEPPEDAFELPGPESYHQVRGALAREALKSKGGFSFTDLPDLLADLDLLVQLSKSTLSTPRDVAARHVTQEFSEHVVLAAEEFDVLRKKRRLRFFDDLGPDALARLEKMTGPDLDRLRGRWTHFIVDEYQDVNEAQQRLLTLVARPANVMVVGDPDQCIYEWRGADPSFILKRFEEDLGSAATYTLSWTFRYGDVLSLSANSVICRNTTRPEDQICVSDRRTPATTIDVHGLDDDPLQAVSGVLEKWTAAGRRLGDVAVLARRWGSLSSLQLQLLIGDVRFRLDEPRHFVLNAPLVRGAKALLRLAATPRPAALSISEREEVALGLLRLFTHVTAVPPEVVEQGRWISDLCDHFVHVAPNKAWLAHRLRDALSSATRERGEVSAARFLGHGPPRELLDVYIKGGMTREARDDRADLLAGLQLFFRRREWSAGEACRQLDALQHQWSKSERASQGSTSRGSASQGSASGADDDGILLTTPFRAKGLEWPLVIAWQLRDGVFPDVRVPIDQERRLFYVTITRAIERLVLVADALDPSPFVAEADVSTARRVADAIRTDSGELEVDPSCDLETFQRYLAAIGSGLTLRHSPPPPPTHFVGSLSSAPCRLPSWESATGSPDAGWEPRFSGLEVGARVTHPKFGPGHITRLSKTEGARTIATVRFAEGDKRVLADYLSRG